MISFHLFLVIKFCCLIWCDKLKLHSSNSRAFHYKHANNSVFKCTLLLFELSIWKFKLALIRSLPVEVERFTGDNTKSTKKFPIIELFLDDGSGLVVYVYHQINPYLANKINIFIINTCCSG